MKAKVPKYNDMIHAVSDVRADVVLLIRRGI